MVGGATTRSSARRAMTLLELLLALTIMASVMGLLAALMGQAHGWTERSVEDEALMRLQRVGEAMRAQWADKRSAVTLNDDGDKVLTTPTQVQFVTATGLLFPDWPLVMATYRIEPDMSHVSASGPLWRLVYVETRLAAMDAPPEQYAIDAQGRSLEDSTILLDGCAELRWERFGRARGVEEKNSSRAGNGAGADASNDSGAEGDTSQGGAASGSKRSSSRDLGAGSAPVKAGADETDDPFFAKEDLQARWRPMEQGFTVPVPAVRLVGSRQGERFGWVFVVKALR